MRVGYSKLGRSIPFDSGKWRMAGEAEAVNLLYRLAKRNPDVEWHVIGKSNGSPDPQYPNIVAHWRDDTPKSAWGVRAGVKAGRMCNDCTAPAPPGANQLYCCPRAKAASDQEDHVIAVTRELDGVVTHLGQHGTSHNFIPRVGWTWEQADADPGSSLVSPYVWAFNYGGYLVRALNAFGDAHLNGGTGRTVWLCADPRNYMNGRDIKWPAGTESEEPVLAQFETTLNAVHERWRDLRSPVDLGFFAKVDGGLWRVQHHYRNSGLDMQMLPDDWENWPQEDFSERDPVGIVSTAAYLPRRDFRRSALIADWVLKAFPGTVIYGKWDERSQADLPPGSQLVQNSPADFAKLLGQQRTTVILPPTPVSVDGQKWCTAKPWQAFAARAVAFMIPPVDAQGWVIPARRPCPGAHEVGPGLWSVRDDWTEEDLHLATWLRPLDPAELQVRIQNAAASRQTWEWLAAAQHRLLTRRWERREIEDTIERRLGIHE